jgi:hypothetical protein
MQVCMEVYNDFFLSLSTFRIKLILFVSIQESFRTQVSSQQHFNVWRLLIRKIKCIYVWRMANTNTISVQFSFTLNHTSSRTINDSNGNQTGCQNLEK